MIQMYTYLDVADNTGAKEVMCIQVLGGNKRRVAYLVVGAGDLRDRPPSLLGTNAAPPGLALVDRSASVTTWRVIPAR